jgi:starvation-inducible DNA-binding protein
MTDQALKKQVSELTPDSGIERKDRQAVARVLTDAVAGTYRLFIMTQGVHWNVQGPLFYSVHKLTEGQYEDMYAAIDDLAERIRALGYPAPQSVADLTGAVDLEEPDPRKPLIEQIQTLIDGHEKLARMLRDGVSRAEDVQDVKSADMLTDRIGVHEENVWMLRATIAA